MTADIDRLLDEMQARCDAATDGPWEASVGEISQSWERPEPWKPIVSTDVSCMSYCYGGSAAGVEEEADAAFIASARTDLPRLVAAVRAVLEMHRPETEYTLSGACALEECDHEDECPGSPIVVCAHCYRVGERAHRYAYEEGGVEFVTYPCPTIVAVDIAATLPTYREAGR